MNKSTQPLCKIRAITVFTSLTQDQLQWKDKIGVAASHCERLVQKLSEQGYEVQSIRIVTNPFGEYINTRDIIQASTDLKTLRDIVLTVRRPDLRIRLSIGEAVTKHEIQLLPELIHRFGDLCNSCVNILCDEQGELDSDRMRLCSETVIKISQMSEGGEGNFNFTVNFNCQPFIPYFPAAYHRSELNDSFVIGLESTDLLLAALCAIPDPQSNTDAASSERRHQQYTAMHAALNTEIASINRVIQQSVNKSAFHFAGFDSSAAPSKKCSSIVDVYKQLGLPYFGASGTVEASALLTRVFKSITAAPLVGFSGLMLAPTEDTGLAQAANNNEFDIRALLTYSAVCGIGLDTVPIPYDTPIDKIIALMRDTGAMAYRLNKPLTVRVFPMPNLKARDFTNFKSDDLCNCAVFSVH